MLYPVLKKVQAEKSNSKTIWKAKLEAKSDRSKSKISITIESPTKEDLKEFVPTIRIGGHYEFKLEPFIQEDNATLDDFSFEESDKDEHNSEI
jgi:hypothetical protein